MLFDQLYPSCDWNDTLHGIEEHLKTVHSNARAPYRYWHTDSIPFIPSQTMQRLNVIDAFNKKFIFYYSSKANSPNVIFLIFLMGRKVDAQKFIIDFELRQNSRKVKFVDDCLCDTDDLSRIIDKNRCIAISKNMIETLLIDGKINFRFIIKRRDQFEAEELNKEQHLMQSLSVNIVDKFKTKPQQPQQPETQHSQFQGSRGSQQSKEKLSYQPRPPQQQKRLATVQEVENLTIREMDGLSLHNNAKWKQLHIANQSPVASIIRDGPFQARGNLDKATNEGISGGFRGIEPQNRFQRKRYINRDMN